MFPAIPQVRPCLTRLSRFVSDDSGVSSLKSAEGTANVRVERAARAVATESGRIVGV